MRIWLHKHQKICIYLSFVVLSFLSLYLVYFRTGHILIGDDYHFHQNRIEGLFLSIKNGDFFPKISYFFIGGYGYASSLFYPDFYLYIPALLRLTGVSLVTSYSLFIVFINFGTFLSTYYAGRSMTLSVSKSYLFSLLYTLAIYRLQDLLNRQALGELLAMTFFPLVLASLYHLKEQRYFKWPLVTFSMTAIGLAHFISLEIVSLFIGMYVLLNFRSFCKKQAIFSFLKATVLTILLLSFYLIPMIEQMRHVTFQVTSNPLTYISERSYTIGQLLMNSLKNSVFHSGSANIGTILFFGMVVYTLVLVRKKQSDKKMIVLALFFMFMVTDLFPWQFFDQTPINTIQFPWRFLSIVTLVLSFLIAKDEAHLFTRYPKFKYLLGVFVLFSVTVYELEAIATQEKRLITYSNYNQVNSFYIGAGHEYLPEEVDYSTIKMHEKRQLTQQSEQVEVTNPTFGYGTASFVYKVKTTQPQNVTIPFIYYYGYKIKRIENGQEEIAQATMNQKNGLVEVSLSGNGQATVYYEWTLVQKLSLALSLCTLILCFIHKKIGKKNTIE